jgi:hypothetical protein
MPEDLTLIVGSVWEKFESLKCACMNYVNKEEFETRTKFKDARRYTLVCKEKSGTEKTDCLWRLHASVPKGCHRFTLKYTEVDEITSFSSRLTMHRFIHVMEL